MSNYFDYHKELMFKSIIEHPIIPDYVKKGLLEYPEELRLLSLVNDFKRDKNGVLEINEVLAGGGRYGGKSIMGAVLALQYTSASAYKCLVTRNTYKDLLAPGKDSIWGYINMWNDKAPDEDKLYVSKAEGGINLISPAGAIITFASFNYDKKADSLQSKSYHRVVSDESPQLSVSIIEDFYPTLRQGLEESFPLSVVHLGNPQLNNPETSEYFTKRFVRGDKPYINMDLNNNPLIDREAYKKSFENLSPAKKEVFLYGNWEYTPEEGSLINMVGLNNALTKETYKDVAGVWRLIGIDLSGRGRDKTALSTIIYNPNNNTKVLTNLTLTDPANIRTALLQHITEDKRITGMANGVLVEMEGGSWVYTEKYLRKTTDELGLTLQSVKPTMSKYMRAVPLGDDLNSQSMLLYDGLKDKFDSNGRSMYDLFCNQIIRLVPLPDFSPDLVDSCTLVNNYYNKKITTRPLRTSVVSV